MRKTQPFNWRMEPSQQANKYLLYIYDDVSEYGQFNWNTWEYDESETSAKYFRDQLNTIPDGAEIELHINSNGGSVKEGTAIYNLLKQKNSTITGIVDGVAHSIAFLILQACDIRKMGMGTSGLIHNMWMSCYGNSKQLRKYADDLDVLSESNLEVFAERAKISREEIKAMMEAETYVTPEQALEYGFIDEIVGKENTVDTSEQLIEQLASMRAEMNSQKSFRQELAIMTQKNAGSASPQQQNIFMNLFK